MSRDIVPQSGESREGLLLDQFARDGETSLSLGGDEQEQGIWSLVNDRLMGRWRYAIPLGLVFAIALCWLGYHSTVPRYESTALIRVAPRIVPVMRETAETGVMPFYQSFVQTQAQLVASQRVLERAAQRMNLDATPWSSQAEAVSEMRRNLKVSPERHSELISINFESESPVVAQSVVNEVTRAYNELFGSLDSEEHNRKMHVLRNLRDELRAERRSIRSRIQELIGSTDYAVGNIDILSERIGVAIHEYEIEMRSLQRSLEIILDRNPELAARYQDENGEWRVPQEEQTATDEPNPQITERDLHAIDAGLAELARQRDRAATNFRRVQARYTSQHRAYRDAEREHEFYQIEYAARAAEVREELEEQLALNVLRVPETTDNPNLAEMISRLRLLERDLDEQRATARSLHTKRVALNDLRTEESYLEQELVATEARIRDLEIESDSIRHGRISIVQLGDLPGSPHRDQRVARAAVGAIFGMGSSLALFFLLGSVDRRTFGATQLTDASGGSYRLLGILPALRKRENDLETSNITAHCVHQIRNRIESVGGNIKGSKAIAVSSPSPADGKTSLVLALGVSYATAGYRTLLVDADLIGPSLTHHSLMDEKSGLRELLQGSASATEAVHAFPLPNLFVLPSGLDPTFGPERVRRDELSAAMSELRKSFDIILVDTGPLLGSIESMPVALACDGIMLTMWRGGRRSRLEDTIAAVHRAGIKCLGVVLNYASASDCNQFVSRSRLSHAVQRSETGKSRGDGNSAIELVSTNNVLMRVMQNAQGDES